LFVVVIVLGTRNPNVVWRGNFGVGLFCPDLDPLQGAFLHWLPQKDQVVLVVKVFLEPIKVGFEADRVRGAEGVAFASGFVRDLGKTSEPEVEISRSQDSESIPPRAWDSRVECAVSK
jgi:hypothetical protein